MRTEKSNILYVDDQESNILIFKNIFDSYYTIFTAPSGAEGIKMIERHQIELVIANHSMPQMSGLQFLKRAALKKANLKSILLVPNSDIDTVNSATKDITVFGYTNNPFDKIETKLLIDWAIELSLTEIEEQRGFKSMGNKSDKLPSTSSSTTKVFIRINKDGIVEKRSPSTNDLIGYITKKEIEKNYVDNFVNKEDRKMLRQKIQRNRFYHN